MQVQNVGHVAAQFFEVINGEVDVEATCDGHQVNHGVGRTANGRQGANGVFKGFARENLRNLHVLVNHVHNAAAGFTGQHIAATIDRRVGRIARQANAQGFHHAGHGTGGAHGHAVAVAAVHAAFGFKEVLQFEGACAHLFAHAPQASARTQFLTAPFAVQHGAARHANGGQVDTGGAHQQ